MRYVMLFHWMLNCEAWKDLSANARVIYLEISKRYNGSNNGFVHYSVREAARDVKIGHATAKRAFDELESHGFIFAEQRGNFHWKIDLTGLRRRPATEWRLTCYDSDRATQFAEKLATKDFMRWQKKSFDGSTTDTRRACSGNTCFHHRHHSEQKGGLWCS
jgi:hypothetical protein